MQKCGTKQFCQVRPVHGALGGRSRAPRLAREDRVTAGEVGTKVGCDNAFISGISSQVVPEVLELASLVTNVLVVLEERGEAAAAADIASTVQPEVGGGEVTIGDSHLDNVEHEGLVLVVSDVTDAAAVVVVTVEDANVPRDAGVETAFDSADMCLTSANPAVETSFDFVAAGVGSEGEGSKGEGSFHSVCFQYVY